MDSKELVKAINLIEEEKKIKADVIYDALELALATAYKKNFDSKTNVKVEINRDNGMIKVFSYMVVVPEIDEGSETTDEEGNTVDVPPEINLDAQILVEDAKKYKSDAKVGDTIEIEVTPKDFGRVAAGTAKQVVMQKIREAEKEVVNEEFKDKENELMIGLVALEDVRNYYIDLGRARGILPKTEIIPGETIVMGSNIKVYITKIEEGPKGPVIKLSRKHYGFVKRLFEHEIPEMQNGDIVIYSCVREPGVRSKIAVYSTNPKIDAIGSCIGERGSRISSILKELNGEKVDLILYNENDEEFIKNALAPAKEVIVNITDQTKKEAFAFVNKDNLSLAIGKKGTNIRLACKLTKYKIEIKSLEEAEAEGNR
jgi:transcription termination/antitermination protein NusA